MNRSRCATRGTLVGVGVLLVVALAAGSAQGESGSGSGGTTTSGGTGTVQIVQGGTGSGRVTSNPAGIDCTIDGSGAGATGVCSASFAAGTRVQLDARAAPGSSFKGWAPNFISDCQNGSPTVKAGATHSCQPVFELNQPSSFLLQASQSGSGRVVSSPAGIDCTFDSDANVLTGQCAANYPSGTTVRLTATPLAGWTFTGWGGDADCSDGTVTMNAAKRCVASFVRGEAGTQTFTLSVTKQGQGTVSSSPAGISCGADCSEAYASGTVVTLTPTAAAGWVFDRWRGDADCVDGLVTMNAGKTCTAEFDER